MICLLAMESNKRIQARSASAGAMASENFRSAAAGFSDLSPIDRFDPCVSGRKVAIQSPRSDACLFGHVIEAGVRAGPGKRPIQQLNRSLPGSAPKSPIPQLVDKVVSATGFAPVLPP
jgi:hypothetical protein